MPGHDAARWPSSAVVVVNGAAGGVGPVVCTCLADRDARVFALDRRPPTLATAEHGPVNVPQQQVAYNASKGGLVARTESLAYEWPGRGARINAWLPGYVDTPLLGSKQDPHDQWKAVTPAASFRRAGGGGVRGRLAAQRGGRLLLRHRAADGRRLLPRVRPLHRRSPNDPGVRREHYAGGRL